MSPFLKLIDDLLQYRRLYFQIWCKNLTDEVKWNTCFREVFVVTREATLLSILYCYSLCNTNFSYIDYISLFSIAVRSIHVAHVSVCPIKLFRSMRHWVFAILALSGELATVYRGTRVVFFGPMDGKG